ncbi:MAG: NlpC/P60 family protein [Bowdeniella nasicola]|nr:NlpC/P60 family protein [Bowdeniella nasicola]
MTETRSARHAAPMTPLAHVKELTATITGGNSKKGVAIAASSGLTLTLAATAAGAVTAPTPEVDARAQVQSTDISAQAKAALQPEASITVADDVKWTAGNAGTIETEKAPEPVVVAAPTRTAPAPASRGGARQAPAPAPAPRTAPPASSDFGQRVVSIAMQYVGTPYVFGGASPGGFDCSGFTQYVYAQVGVQLPRTTGGQRNAGYVVPASQARPGDLIWWPGHVGIYLGNGQHIAARNPSTPLTAGPIYRGGATFIRLGG